MANTNQIFEPRVLAKAAVIDPAVFSQPIRPFAPLDLTALTEADKMEYMKQKLAIDAEKNRIDLEEAKVRLKIAENAIVEKRKAENKAIIKMFADQMDLKGNEQNESWRSKESQELFAQKNGEYNQLIAVAGSLTPDELAARSNAWQTKWATHTRHANLMREDEYMKRLIKESEKNGSNINPTLLQDLIAKNYNGEIIPSQVDPNSLIVDDKYMATTDTAIAKELGKIYTVRESEPSYVNGRWEYKVRDRKTPDYEQTLVSAASAILKDPNYQLYLTNQARANQLLKKGVPNSIGNLEDEVLRLSMDRAKSVASKIPDLDANQLNHLSRSEKIYIQKSQAGTSGGDSYTTYYSPSGRAIGEVSPKGNTDSEVFKTEARIDVAYNKVGTELNGKPYNGVDSTVAADDINKTYPGAAYAIDTEAKLGDVRVSITPEYIKVGRQLFLSKETSKVKEELESQLQGTVTLDDAATYHEFMKTLPNGATILKGTKDNTAYIINPSKYKSNMTVESIKKLKNGEYISIEYTPKTRKKQSTTTTTKPPATTKGTNTKKGKFAKAADKK